MKKIMLSCCAFLAGTLVAATNDALKWDPRMAEEIAVTDTNGVKWIDGKALPIEGRCFANVDHYYDRLPATVTTNVNAGVRSMKHHTSGMMFRFVTDSRTLHFKWKPYNAGLAMDHMPSTGVSGIDVYRRDSDGVWRYRRTGRIYDAEKGGSLTMPWTPGAECIVNLPLYNGIKEFLLGIDETAKITAPPPRPSGVTKPVVFYGTSITQGGCASRPGMGFVNIVGRMLDVPVVGLGFSGSGRMEFEMSEHLAAIDASCYVIDCAWNMSPELIRSAVVPFVKNLRRLRPDVPIVMTAPCDVFCGTDPVHNAPNREKAMRGEYLKLVQDGVKGLSWLPREEQLGDDFEGTVDGVHPNDLGMSQIARGMAPAIRNALNAYGDQKIK